MLANKLLTNADDALHISIFDTEECLRCFAYQHLSGKLVSICDTDDALHVSIYNPKRSFALTFAGPPLRVPSLEYPDIHLSGPVSHFQQST